MVLSNVLHLLIIRGYCTSMLLFASEKKWFNRRVFCYAIISSYHVNVLLPSKMATSCHIRKTWQNKLSTLYMWLDLWKVSCTHNYKYLEIQHYKFNSLYLTEGNLGYRKIRRMQHMNIHGGIKFDKLVKVAFALAHLHAFLIQRNIWSYCNLWMKGMKLAW